MTWNEWLRDRKIETHEPSLDEIAAQRRAAERSLSDASLPELSSEGRFQLAYDAGLALATLVVLASGHRVKSRIGHHQITIQAAGIVLGKEGAGFTNYFDLCRRRRNVISYEGDEIGREQAVELVEAVRRFSCLVDRWLKEHRPELLP